MEFLLLLQCPPELTVPEEWPVPALDRFHAEELEPYKCNHCRELVRGAVMASSSCCQLFCWLRPHPHSPRCRTALILHEDILEGLLRRETRCQTRRQSPGQTGGKASSLGHLNRPEQKVAQKVAQKVDEELQIVHALNHILDSPLAGGLCRQIDATQTWFQRLQVVYAVLIGLLFGFVSLT